MQEAENQNSTQNLVLHLAQAETEIQAASKKKKKQEDEVTTTDEADLDSNVSSDTTTSTTTSTTKATGTVTDTTTTGEPVDDSEVDTTNTNTTATTTTSIEDAFKNVDLNNPSWDLFLVGFFVVGALLYGVSLGKDRIISIMVSIYMALAVVAALPDFVLNIKVNENYTLQITAFIAIFVVLFFLLSRQAVLNSLAPSTHGKWWQVLLFSILHVGLLVSVTLSFMPPEMVNKFSGLTQYIFTNEWTRFGWIIAPIIAMIFVGRSAE